MDKEIFLGMSHLGFICSGTQNVATLTLGSQPYQGLAKVWVESEAQESHFIFPGM